METFMLYFNVYIEGLKSLAHDITINPNYAKAYIVILLGGYIAYRRLKKCNNLKMKRKTSKEVWEEKGMTLPDLSPLVNGKPADNTLYAEYEYYILGIRR